MDDTKNSIIEINTSVVRSKIELLKVEKEKIDAVLEDFKGGSLKIKDFWSGGTGDEISEDLKGYITKFDYISSKLARFITFLEGVCASYDKEDADIIRDMEKLLSGIPKEKGIVKNYEYNEE